jgi:hypothetical protein
VSGHQRLAVRRQLPQKTDPDAGRLLGVVFEAVVPVGVLEPDLEHEVAGERQPVAAGPRGDCVSGLTMACTRCDLVPHIGEFNHTLSKWCLRSCLSDAPRCEPLMKRKCERIVASRSIEYTFVQ